MRRSAASLGGAAGLVGLALGALPGLASPACAQERPGPEPAAAVRVVEFFDPATGQREHATAAQLGPGEIAALQRALERAGVPVTPTGRLDAATAAALARFQTRSGLEPCGCPSYETLVALGLPTRTFQTVVRRGPAGREPRAGPEPSAPKVEIVYGTPPPRPAGADGRGAERPGGVGAPGAGATPAAVAEPPAAGGPSTHGFAHGHSLLFPFFLHPGPLFPPQPLTGPTPETAPRGLPFGQRVGSPDRRGISFGGRPPAAPRPAPSPPPRRAP